ncbi:MAG: shikimate kinase [Thermoplasmatota archaeon]
MARAGRGEAFGAVSIVNATATGTGCSLATNLRTTTTWTPGGDGLRVKGAPDLRLVEAVALELGADRGADVEIACPLPPSRGLKSSSSVAAALVRAVLDADGASAPTEEVEGLAVAACRRAGVTLTGALDDQAAVVRGGCQLADNRKGRVLAGLAVPPWQVAVWIPDAAIDKAILAPLDLAPVTAAVKSALALAQAGRVAEAMTANGRAYHAAYAAAGLPVDDLPVRVALSHGALGAGLSGTGPAVAALFDRRVVLPPVTGGTWRWTRTVPASVDLLQVVPQ